MKLINNVNNLDGKQWLRNSINFYEFDNFNIENIEKKFKDYCYKKRTTGLYMLNEDEQIVDDYDFTFKYVKRINDLNVQLNIIKESAYNSYHVIICDDHIIEDVLISKKITDYIELNKLEYRGKIILYFTDSKMIKQAYLILNRIEKDDSEIMPKDITPRYSFSSQYVINSKSKIDKIGLKHPAPYSYIDINNICEIEQINNSTILDPFLGVGSTILGSYKNNYNIGIEINKQYIDLIKERIDFLNIDDLTTEKYKIIRGDCLKKISTIKEKINYVITSPPYFNILKNKSKGIRHDSSQSRQGIEYYTDLIDDLGNYDNYNLYLDAMTKLFKKIYKKMDINGEVYLIISDFTINKKEKDIHSDMIITLNNAGYTYEGTSYILQNQKSIYPFGYPYKLVLNHIYQYIIKFRKD